MDSLSQLCCVVHILTPQTWPERTGLVKYYCHHWKNILLKLRPCLWTCGYTRKIYVCNCYGSKVMYWIVNIIICFGGKGWNWKVTISTVLAIRPCNNIQTNKSIIQKWVIFVIILYTFDFESLMVLYILCYVMMRERGWWWSLSQIVEYPSLTVL